MKEQSIKHLIYIIILINTLFGQFNNFDSNIDLRQIRENERFYFENTIQDINDFFIVVFSNNLDNEYMLLYKNFSTRILASDYCLKHLNFLQKCLIVNAQNLN